MMNFNKNMLRLVAFFSVVLVSGCDKVRKEENGTSSVSNNEIKLVQTPIIIDACGRQNLKEKLRIHCDEPSMIMTISRRIKL